MKRITFLFNSIIILFIIFINIRPASAQISAGEDQTICLSCGTTILMNATAPALGESGKWIQITGTPSTLTNSTLHNTTIQLAPGSNTYTFEWRIGSKKDQVTVNVIEISAGTKLNICTNTAKLTGTNPSSLPGGAKGKWLLSGGFGTLSTTTDYIVNISKLGEGENRFTWQVTLTNGCVCSNEVVVQNNSPSVSFAGVDKTICTDEVLLNPSQPSIGTGKWTVASAGVSIVGNSRAINLPRGVTKFTWKVTNLDCSSESYLFITNNSPTKANASSDQDICGNSSTLLGNSPTSGETGGWSKITGSGDIAFPASFFSQVTNITTATNTYRWTITRGTCTAYDDITIRNNTPIANAGNNINVCSNQATLTAQNQGIASGRWSGGGGISFANESLYTTKVYNLLAGENNIEWRVTMHDCVVTDYVLVTNDSIYVNAGDNQAVCNNTTDLIANNPGKGNLGKWTRISGSSEFKNPTLFNTSVTKLSANRNVFVWTVSNSKCSATDTLEVINNTVVADAGFDQHVCTNSSTLAPINPGTGIKGKWYRINGSINIINSSLNNTDITNLEEENTYEWRVTKGQCTASDYVNIFSNAVTAQVDNAQVLCTDYAIITATVPLGAVGKWSLEAGSIGTIDSPSQYSTLVTDLGEGLNTFRWTVHKAQCTAYALTNVTNNSVSAIAGGNQSVCGNSTTLTGNSPITGALGKWSVEGSSTAVFTDAQQHNTTVNSLKAGVNKFEWKTTKNNCADSSYVIITNDLPTTAKAGQDVDLCDNTSVLNANNPSLPGETGLWTRLNGTSTIANTKMFSTNVTNLSAGRNIFIWSISNNDCVSTDTIIITTNPAYANAGGDQSICENFTNLAASNPNPLKGKWVVINGTGIFTNSSLFNTKVTNLSPGDNTFSWSVSNNECTAIDYVTVINNSVASATAGDNQPVCTTTATLLASAPETGTGRWTIEPGSSATLESNTRYNTKVFNLSKGANTFRWSVVEGNCSATSVVVIENNLPDASAGADYLICEEAAILVANNPGSGKGIWTIKTGNGTFSNSSTYLTVVTNLNKGANTLQWTVSENNCSASDEMVLINNAFIVTAGSDLTICGTSANLQASEAINGTGKWSVVGGAGVFGSKTAYSTIVDSLNVGANTFRWTVESNGCSASDIVVVYNNEYASQAGEDQIICQSNTQLAAVAPEVGTGEWLIISGSGIIADPLLPTSKVTSLVRGKNIFRWVVSTEECTAFNDVEIYNNSIDAHAGIDEAICEDKYILTAAAADSTARGEWSIVAGNAVFASKTLANTPITELYGGANTLKWTIFQNGCTASDLVMITNNSFRANAGENIEVVSDNTSLSAELPDNAMGEWSLLSGSGVIENKVQLNTDVRKLGIGVNTFLWTVTLGSCSATDEVEVIYKAFRAKAGFDQVLCFDSTDLFAGQPDIGKGKWSLLSGSANIATPSVFNTKVTKIGSGVNIFRWTVEENGVVDFDDMTITNNSFAVSAGSNKELCYDYTTLDAAKPDKGIGSWSVKSGSGTFSTLSLHNTLVRGLKVGENILVWTVVHNNCTAFDEASFFYNKPPTAQFTVDYDEGCSPLKVEFTNNTVGAKSYLWDFGDGAGYGKTDTSHTYINDENLDTAFKVTLKAISVKGCMDTIYLLISVHTLPEIGISAQPLTQEFPSSTVFIENLSGDGEVNYIWDFGDGKFSQEKNPVNHKYTTWGTYTIKLEMRSDFCSKESSENVTIAPPVPDCEFSFLGAGCEPFDVEFKNLNAPNNAASYSWDFGDKSALSSEASPKHTYELAGSYTVTLTANGYGGQTCTKSDTVEVYPLPFADFEINPSEVMIPHAVHFFNYSTHADSVQWDFGDKATGIDSIANVKNPVYKYTTVGTYSVLLQVWSKYGCYDSAKMVNAIFVKEAGELIFPTAFTPNTSGSNGGAYPANVRERELNNDIFYPVARGIDVYNLKIYNRWGVLIFESFDLYVGWDGYSNSKLCSQDAYIWKATGKYKSGQSFEKSGSVTLVR